MKNILVIISGLALSTGISFAQQSFEELDLNGDGMLNVEEASSNPKVIEMFKVADVDQDGMLSEEEFIAINQEG